MRFTIFVLIPFLVQVMVGLIFIFVRRPGGEFVPLSVMLLGMFAIPLTAIFNWARTRARPPLPVPSLITRTFFYTLIFPVLCLALYVLAS